MALLTILVLLLSFVILGVGSSSSGTTHKVKPTVKCSKRMTTDSQGPRCGPPPANP
jgi:hypothetical protein